MTVDDILKEDDARMVRKLTPYDPLQGEDPSAPVDMARCMEDFEYWAAKCCYIKNKKAGPDILFRLNRPQRKLVAALENMRKANKPIRLILLKARQWGGSTCTQLYMAWLQMIHKECLNSLIVAHQHAATAEIKEMFVRMIESYPEELLTTEEEEPEDEEPKRKKRGRKKKIKRICNAGPGAIRCLHHNFKVKVGSAEKPNSCRGGDYSLLHCSEVAMWRATKLKTPEEMFKSATGGVLYEPLTMILMESTANGTGNFFYDEYQSAKNGDSQFAALFVAWYEIEQYSLPFLPGEREKFAAQLLEHKDNSEPVSPRAQSGAYLWWLWTRGASLDAIHWYIKERAKYSDHGNMASEYPSDDIEAFVHSGARVFDKYHVEDLREGCKKMPRRGEITGREAYGPGSLRGLKFIPDSQGALLIWSLPDTNRNYRVTDRYLTVVDIGGRSLKADWSVVTVFDREPMLRGEGPEVVAQWRGHTDFDLLAWNAARIALVYNKSLLVIESNTLETHDRDRNVEGDQSSFLLDQLKEAYPNLYARKRKPEDIREGKPVKYGFHTNTATKPLIISHLVKVVRERLYTERDEGCLEEYLTYEKRADGSYGAINGKHDDILMTRAIGLHIAFNEMDMPRHLSGDPSPVIPSRRGSYASF